MKDPSTHGAVFAPIILGSDKTTVSVATGHSEYYPLYVSNGIIQNHARRVHRNRLGLLGFLSVPKSKFKFVNLVYLFLLKCFISGNK